MLFRKRQTVSGVAPFTLVMVTVPRFDDLLVNATPEDVILLMEQFQKTCAGALHRLRCETIHALGNYILAASPDDSTTSRPDSMLGMRILMASQETKTFARQKGFDHFGVAVAMTRGTCLFERQKDKFVKLYGFTINRLDAMLKKFAVANDTLIVDETIDVPDNCQREVLAENIYRLTYVTP